MIVDEKETIEKTYSKFVPRLSQEEKDVIERIAGITGYKYKVVKNVFLALSILYGMDLSNEGDDPEISIPFQFKVKTKFEEDFRSGKRNLIPVVDVDIFYAMKNIIEKISKKEISWLHEYFKTQTRNILSQSLDHADNK